MDEPLKFNLAEIAPPDEFLRMSSEERIQHNNLMANRCLKLEAFMETTHLGWNFIKSQHVHTR